MSEWTSSDETRLVELAAQGASVIRAASCLHRSTSAIKRRAREMGIQLKDAKAARLAGGLKAHWAENR